MKKRLIFAVIFSIVLIFSACGKTSETAKLESRILKLESEVENLKNPPATTPSEPVLKDEKTSSYIEEKTNSAENATTTSQPPETITVSKTYGINEDFTCVENGKALYTLKITKVQKTNERNEYGGMNQAQVVIIDYSYTNLAVSQSDSFRGMFLSNIDFNIIDEKGTTGTFYPIANLTEPKDTKINETCTAQFPIGLDNVSNTITIKLCPTFFSSSVAEFKAPVS